MAKREYVTELCEQLSRSLHVAKHNVVGKAAWLPADATMHISKVDGRLCTSQRRGGRGRGEGALTQVYGVSRAQTPRICGA